MFYASKRHNNIQSEIDTFQAKIHDAGQIVMTYDGAVFAENKVPKEIQNLHGRRVFIVQSGGSTLTGCGYYDDDPHPMITVKKNDRVTIHIWPVSIETMYVAKAKEV